MSKPTPRKIRALLAAAVLASSVFAATVPASAAPADTEVSARSAKAGGSTGATTFQGISWL